MSWINLVGKSFHKFFESNGYMFLQNHKVYNPLSRNILFNNSGVAGIYEYFNGVETKQSKMCTIQKSIRIVGSHSDIENIGKSNSHMIVFNMIGTFGFIDIDYKKMFFDIIEFLLSIGLNARYMTLTYHSKDDKGLNLCKECKEKYGLDYRDTDENVWSIGDNTSASYCVEIMYFHKGQEVEIWNCVMCDDYKKIDSGAGLERIAFILAGLNSIYELDEFRSFLDLIPECNDNVMLLNLFMCVDSMIDTKITVSNNKRGYIMKKLLRKAIVIIDDYNYNVGDIVSYGYKLLNNIHYLSEILNNEYNRYQELKKELCKLLKDKTVLTVNDIFYYYDSHGISISYTKSFANKNNIQMPLDSDIDQYIKDMNKRNVGPMTTHKLGDFNYCDSNVVTINSTEYDLMSNSKNGLNAIFAGSEYDLIMYKSNVKYPAGGDVGDQGIMTIDDHEIKFDRLYKGDNYVRLRFVPTFSVDQIDKIQIKRDRYHRSKMDGNHSLLHIVIRSIEIVLGINIMLIDSVVDNKNVKAKILCSLPILIDQLKIEDEINSIIKHANWSVKKYIRTFNMYEFDKENIRYISHIEYNNTVQIVEISDGSNMVSKEVCGGNHSLENINNIDNIKINEISMDDSHRYRISFSSTLKQQDN